MTTPTTSHYVRPGQASSAWSYAGTPASAVTAVAFDAASSLGQAFARGDMQYSQDYGRTWLAYTMPVDGQGAYVATAGTLWRFQDRLAGDGTTPDTFGVHYKLADGSVVTAEDTVFPDSQPVGIVGGGIVFTTAHAGDIVDVVAGIDTGDLTGGRWVIESQSQPGLFGISYNSAVDTAARLVVADASQLPAGGLSAAVTVHYYDRYQVDANGNPLPNTGVTQVLTYAVEDGATDGLPGFANESKAGAALDAWTSAPALATLAGGGVVAVWQGQGAGLWAQLRDAAGNPLGAAFALTPNGDAGAESQPAVAALAGGRFVVAYTLNDGGANKIAYRVVDAGGSAGAGHVLDTGASGDAAMPAVATLADGSFAVGWRSGATVHVQQAAADGTPAGAQQVYDALGSAYSPALAALADGGYVVSWGEINDGNVYAALSRAPASVFVASGDGYAASTTTAAPLPHVAALAGGGFVVAWDSYVNDPWGFANSDIFFQRFDAAGHAVGAVTQANVASGGGHDDADVAALSDGSFLVAWQGADGDGNGIFGRRFDGDGNAIDSQEFGISQLRSGDQASADVTALAGGGFAGAWIDTGASGMASVEMRVLPGVAPAAAPAGVPTAGVQDVPAPAPAPAPAPVASPPAAGTSAALSKVASVAMTNSTHVLAAVAGESKVTGTSGVDTLVYTTARAGATIVAADGAVSVTDAVGNHATLAGVERIQFNDGVVALDVNGSAGAAYRLYQAAFARTPDKTGLGFWIDALDKGTPLAQAASGFIGSAEFAKLYGSNVSDAQFVDALYQNVLHRAPDAAGYAFWTDALHSTSRADVLTGFSESAENKAQVATSIGNGIDYVVPAGGTLSGSGALKMANVAFNGNAHVLQAVAGDSKVTGTAGVDTLAYTTERAGATVVADNGVVSVKDAVGNHATLTGVERLQFGDGMVALDVNGNAGEAYRLYQAALGRTPDKTGLGFWIDALDKGTSLAQAASGFIGSAEFGKLYGTHVSDAQFVEALYQNVLHRAPDAAGYAFWTDALHSTSRADVLVGFSESTENQAQVIGSIQNGIDYLHWG